jgi:hypothetical protein
MTLALAATLFVALVGWWLLSLFGPNPPIRVSKQTTYLTAPLAADGLPDYAAAIDAELKKGVTPQNNGAVPFLEAMWTDDTAGKYYGYSPDQTKLLAAALGVPLPPPSGSRFADRESKAMKQRAKQLIESRSSPGSPPIDLQSDEVDELVEPQRRWTRSELPFLAKWVDENAAAFELLHEAASRSDWYMPSYFADAGPRGAMSSLNMSSVASSRQAQRCLAVRSGLYLGEGSQDRAAADVVAMLKLATRGWNRDRLLIDDLVCVACIGVGIRQALQLADHTTTPPAALRTVLAEVQAAGNAIDLGRTYDRHERLYSLSTVIDYACRATPIEDAFPSTSDAMARMARATSVDWNEVLIAHNDYLDSTVAIARLSDWSTRWKAAKRLDQCHDKFDARWGSRLFGGAVARGRELGHDLLCLGMSPFSSMVRAVDTHRTRCQLATLAIACAIHRAEKGAYPDKLEQLVPDVLPSLPVDLYHGKPFVYRKTADGFLLSSCGPNGVDDGGSNDGTSDSYSSYHLVFEGVEFEDASDPRAKQIPTGADDASVRFPLPVEPWPWEKGAAAGSGSGD